MDAAAELGRNPVSKHQFSLSMEMSRLTRNGTAEPVSRDEILTRDRGQIFLHPVDQYSCYMFNHIAEFGSTG